MRNNGINDQNKSLVPFAIKTIPRHKKCKDKSYLGGADKASGYDLGNDTHEVFGFMDNTINFGESSGFTDSRVLDCKLELLHIVGHSIQVF